MAITISGDGPNVVQRLSLGAAGEALAVTLPSWGRTLTVLFVQSDGTTADSGRISVGVTESDGGAISSHAMPIGEGGAYAFHLGGGGRVIDGATVYLAGDTASGYAHIHVER